VNGPSLTGSVDTSALPFRARVALALAVLFRSPVDLPVKLPPMRRELRRSLVRRAKA